MVCLAMYTHTINDCWIHSAFDLITVSQQHTASIFTLVRCTNADGANINVRSQGKRSLHFTQ